MRHYRHDVAWWDTFATTNSIVAVGAFTQLAGVVSLNQVAQMNQASDAPTGLGLAGNIKTPDGHLAGVSGSEGAACGGRGQRMGKSS